MNRMLTKTELCAVALAIALLPLSGCKTTESAMTAAPAQAERVQTAIQPVAAQPKAGTTYDPRIVEDDKYISYVERLALRRGVNVRWVNKPHKRVVDQASAGSSQ
jgi:hypothetical protein